MDCEIRFLNAKGKLCCSLRAGFISEQADARYAQAVMMAGPCRQYVSAEICDQDHPDPLFVLWQNQFIVLDRNGAVRSSEDAGPSRM